MGLPLPQNAARHATDENGNSESVVARKEVMRTHAGQAFCVAMFRDSF